MLKTFSLLFTIAILCKADCCEQKQKCPNKGCIQVSFVFKNKEYFKFKIPNIDCKDIDYVLETFTKSKNIYSKFLCLWHYMTLAKSAYFPQVIELVCADVAILSKKNNAKQFVSEINTSLSKLGYHARNATAFFYKNEKLVQTNKLPRQLKARTDDIIIICRKLATQLKQLCEYINHVYNEYSNIKPTQLTQYINDGSKVYDDIAKYFETKISDM